MYQVGKNGMTGVPIVDRGIVKERTMKAYNLSKVKSAVLSLSKDQKS